MRVLIVNTAERTGGAAIAANRLLNALNHNGVEARMLVRDRKTDSPVVVSLTPSWRLKANFLWERGVIWLNNGLSKRGIFQVDIANAGTDITMMPEFRDADVIHLHWVNQGFLSLAGMDRIIASGKPVVMTMHDQWYYTGICHYAGDCDKYQSQCSHCPMLRGGGIGMDLARRVFDRKRAIYEGKNLTFVGCSRWIADLARKSRLTRGHKVTNAPNAIDTSVFSPMDKQQARARHKLPEGKRLLLFGAQRITDERKGFNYLKEACEHIVKSHPSLAATMSIVVLGGDADSVKESLPLPVHVVNYLSNEHDIASLYNAVDLFVTPSLQDNLPNTIVEAMACGTPCVGFDVGGIPEMISHKQNGYVAHYRDSEDFARGIIWCMDESRHDTLRQQARTAALNTYAEPVAALRYQNIYRTCQSMGVASLCS
jgi:glycosyltransferase involved in cell wall biosynthesis